MAAYYYISATLPLLHSPDQAPPIQSAELLDIGKRFMSEREFTEFAGCTISPEGSGSGRVAVNYRLWERSLRNELVKLRAVDQGLEADGFFREADSVYGTQEIAAAAMKKATPLEAEIYLIDQRWTKIEEMTSGHFFDMEFLCGYRLKLLLLERRLLFDDKKGSAAYLEIHNCVLETTGRIKDENDW